ncbi:unnamed protein product [Zymoseptoria tritici ST99CH_1E4]|uniref:Thioesterase domain-containing protein n=2 Tax=Zymoseptoria tritici TaxID=1047171 RepID=A0A2H1FWQ7_ZYMTR|nr:unnamed protein product [Zymoseptoria tritici ST99CH_1E4]
MPISKDTLPPGVFFRVDIADPMERVAAYIAEYNMDHPSVDRSKPPSFDSVIMTNNVRVISVSMGPPLIVTTAIDIRPELCSRTGNLHGGAAALIFDMCTSMSVAPLATATSWPFGGVSRHLTVSYIRPVPVGITVHIVCEVASLGKNISTITARMQTEDGKLLCLGQHDKVYVDIAARSNKM